MLLLAFGWYFVSVLFGGWIMVVFGCWTLVLMVFIVVSVAGNLVLALLAGSSRVFCMNGGW